MESFCHSSVSITSLLYHYRVLASLASVQILLLSMYSEDYAGKYILNQQEFYLLVSVLKTYCIFTALNVQTT